MTRSGKTAHCGGKPVPAFVPEADLLVQKMCSGRRGCHAHRMHRAKASGSRATAWQPMES